MLRFRVRSSQRLIALALCLLVVQSCAARGGLPGNSPDKDIEQIAETLDVTTQALSVFQKAVISSNQQAPKLISDPTADTLVKFSLEMNKAAKEAITATRAVAKLSPEERRNIGKILTPISLAVDNTLKSPGLTGIQSEQLRLVLQTSLTSIQTTVASVQLVLAAGR